MDLTEAEIIEKYAKNCGHCNRNTLLPYEHEFSCIACGYNVNKRKNELSKIQRKKINFINRLKYAEQNEFCICIDLYTIYEGNDYDEICKVLSTLKNKKLKKHKILIEKYKNMLENYWSRTAKGIHRIGNDSIRLTKWICYYDRSYFEKIKYYDMMGSVCRFVIEITKFKYMYSYTNIKYLNFI